MRAAVHTRRAFSVVFSRVWLPATVVMARRSITGQPRASRMAMASSWPGSQSRMIGLVTSRPSLPPAPRLTVFPYSLSVPELAEDAGEIVAVGRAEAAEGPLRLGAAGRADR